jgi:hypothetical protein|tara:strand:+ start:267 stop:539 length:273 start_codon:yes stop_codon:yes gene_type:complete
MKKIVIFGIVLGILVAGLVLWNSSEVRADGEGRCICSTDNDGIICCSCSAGGGLCSGHGTPCGGSDDDVIDDIDDNMDDISWTDLKNIYA